MGWEGQIVDVYGKAVARAGDDLFFRKKETSRMFEMFLYFCGEIKFTTWWSTNRWSTK